MREVVEVVVENFIQVGMRKNLSAIGKDFSIGHTQYSIYKLQAEFLFLAF